MCHGGPLGKARGARTPIRVAGPTLHLTLHAHFILRAVGGSSGSGTLPSPGLALEQGPWQEELQGAGVSAAPPAGAGTGRLPLEAPAITLL